MFTFIRDFCVRLWVAFFWPTRSRTVVLPKGEVQISALIAQALNGVPEYLLPDKARVDILTHSEAIEVDWNEQAAKAGKNYLSFTAFSKKGLIEQLEFDGYTKEQAKYGASANGL